MIADLMTLRGHVRLELRGPGGDIRAVREVDNLVVSAGRDAAADRLLAAPTISPPSHMGVGSGATAPALGDTALQTEVDRQALTSWTRAGRVLTAVANWAAGEATHAALTEAGLFSGAGAPDATHPMYLRATFGAMEKTADDTLAATWTLTVG